MMLPADIQRGGSAGAAWAKTGIQSPFIFLPFLDNTPAAQITNYGNVGPASFAAQVGEGLSAGTIPTLFERNAPGFTGGFNQINYVWTPNEEADLISALDFLAGVGSTPGVGGGVLLVSMVINGDSASMTPDPFQFERPLIQVGDRAQTFNSWLLMIDRTGSNPGSIVFERIAGPSSAITTDVIGAPLSLSGQDERITILFDAFGGAVHFWKDSDARVSVTTGIVDNLKNWSSNPNAGRENLSDQGIGATLLAETALGGPGVRTPNRYNATIIKDLFAIRLDSIADTIDGIKDPMVAALHAAPRGTLPRYFEGL